MCRRILYLFITVVSVSLVSGQLDSSVCTPANVSVIAPPPGLSGSYSAVIEWKDVFTNMTYTVLDYYDTARKIGSMTVKVPPHTVVKMVFDYSSGDIMVVRDRNCEVHKIRLTSFFFYDDKEWLRPLHSLYREMVETADVVFVNSSTIRSYPVGQWTTCMYAFQQNMTTKADMYFAGINSIWFMADLQPGKAIPIRLNLFGKHHTITNTETFKVSGDIISFSQAPTFQPDTFLTPPGVFCPGRSDGIGMPSLGNTFSLLMEVLDVDYQHITYDQVWFDAPKKLVRHDSKTAVGNDVDPQSVVYDFNTGMKYTKDKYMKTCHIDIAQPGDEYVVILKNRFISMMDVNEVFHLKNAEVQYVGQTVTKNVNCDVWVGVYFDTNANRNATVQWYFTTRDWKEAVGSVINGVTLFRMDVWKGGSMNPKIHYISEYLPTPQDWSVFNYGDCYHENNKLHFVIFYEVLDPVYFEKVSRSFLLNRMQTQLSSELFLVANRLTDLKIEFDGNNKLFLSGTLLEKAPMTNKLLNNSSPERPLHVVYSFMTARISGKITILVENTDKQPVRLQSKNVFQISYPTMFTTTTTQNTPSVPFLIPTLPSQKTTHELIPQIETTKSPLRTTPVTTALPLKCPTSTPPKCPTQTVLKCPTPTPPKCPTQTRLKCPTPKQPTTLPLKCPTSTPPKCPTQTVLKCPTPTPPKCPTQTQLKCPTPKQPTTVLPKCTCPQQPKSPLKCPTMATPQDIKPCSCPQTLNRCSCPKLVGSTTSLTLEQPQPGTDTEISTGVLAGAIIGSLLVGILLCFITVSVLNRYIEIPFLKMHRGDVETIPLGPVII